MKNRFKVSIWFIAALIISSLVSVGSALAKKPVHVDPIPHPEPKEQCYEFVAEDQPRPPTCTNAKSSIWLVKTVGANCNVQVWAGDADKVNCDTVKRDGEHITPLNPRDLAATIPGPKKRKLSSAITAGPGCDNVWLRFSDDDNCNSRCYINNGRAYCR